MKLRVVRPLSAAAWCSLLGLGLLSCVGERTALTDAVGPPSYNFRLAVGTQKGLPRTAGTDSTYLTLVAFDTTVADAYARSGDLAISRRKLTLPVVGTSGWDLTNTVRRLTVDGRAPRLVKAASANLLTLEGPDAAGGQWRFSLTAWDLSPDSTYAVALVRYGLVRLDSLDQVAVLNTGSNFPALVRDTLKVLGGTGSSPVVAGGCEPANAVAASTTANPLVLGRFTAVPDPYGIGTGFTAYDAAADAARPVQFCLRDPTGLYYRGTTVDPSRTPIAPNRGVTFSLPQYNYLIVYNVATGAQILRAQLGQDLSFTNGSPVNNAFAPMPCRIAPRDFYFTNYFTGSTRTLCNFSSATDVLTTRLKISAPGGEGSADTVKVSLRGLGSLAGTGVYQAWLTNPATQAAPIAAVGRLVAIGVDTISDVPVLVTRTTVVDSGSGRSTFVGYDMPLASHMTYTLTLTAASTGVNLRDYTHVLFTAESGPGASAPSARRALWAKYGDQRGTATDYRDDEWVDKPVLTWGAFNPTAGPTYTFTVAGRGLGGFREDELSIDLNDLSRPPSGYYYKAWLVDVNGGATGTDTLYVPVDTLRSPFPERTLLFDADSALVASVVQESPPIISAANIRNFAGNMGLSTGTLPFAAYENVIITLAPKGSNPATPGPSIVFRASIPSIVKTGSP